MPTVENTVWSRAPLEVLYAVAKDNERFPEFMSDVKAVQVLESDGRRVVSHWSAVVPTFRLKVRWTQEDVWDDAARTCRFRQLEGDYDRLEGVWTFREENGGTRFDSFCEYEYNVPTLGPLVKKVVHALVIKNLDNVLQAIAKRAESIADRATGS
ncbi:MAG: SRPBCC family protein [Fimbriimonadales bacterium]|nr:SRPBCC family protein [Fimbriimonadales bacterium]